MQPEPADMLTTLTPREWFAVAALVAVAVLLPVIAYRWWRVEPATQAERPGHPDWYGREGAD